MELLNEIAHISGKSGLFRVLKPTRTGVIVETLDAAKQKSVVGGQTRISVLKDISLYLDDHQDSTLPLGDIFIALHGKFNGTLPLEPKKANDAELFALLAEVVPNYNQDRVYASDIKKILSWYVIMFNFLPEIFPALEKKEKAPKKERAEAEVKEEKEPKTKKAKK
ncbi:MAG: Dephospho-CoA kinase [Bacteroidota bacterium]